MCHGSKITNSLRKGRTKLNTELKFFVCANRGQANNLFAVCSLVEST